MREDGRRLDVTMDAPSTRFNDTAHAIAERVRGLREEADLSQGELARRVYVSRQTVNNWEAARTLPDIESLKLLAAEFDVSVDDLLGAGREALMDDTVDDRHRLLVAVATQVVLCLVFVACQIVLIVFASSASSGLSYGDEGYASYQGVRFLLQFLSLAIILGSTPSQLRMDKIMRDRDLADALAVVSYIEGRKPGNPLPDDILYRFVLPHWRALRFLAAALLVVMAVCLGLVARYL